MPFFVCPAAGQGARAARGQGLSHSVASALGLARGNGPFTVTGVTGPDGGDWGGGGLGGERRADGSHKSPTVSLHRARPTASSEISTPRNHHTARLSILLSLLLSFHPPANTSTRRVFLPRPDQCRPRVLNISCEVFSLSDTRYPFFLFS